MHPAFETLFKLLSSYQIAIIGSVLKDFDKAGDIDILFLDETEFKKAVSEFKVKYSGWDRKDGHVRRANVSIPGIRKKVQFTQHSAVTTFQDHPFCSLQRDGNI